jgi:hypothetical protein
MNKENIEVKENDINRYLYDTKEDIKKCLECTKAACNNCLKHKNFI